MQNGVTGRRGADGNAGVLFGLFLTEGEEVKKPTPQTKTNPDIYGRFIQPMLKFMPHHAFKWVPYFYSNGLEGESRIAFCV